METFGNTDKATGEGSSLTVVYQRDPEHRAQLNYIEHTWGRITTSEMVSFDQIFPPRMVEGNVEELDDEAVDALINASLKRLAKGAQVRAKSYLCVLWEIGCSGYSTEKVVVDRGGRLVI